MAWFGASGCSVIVGDETKQCKTHADCAKFPGALCAADGVCKVVNTGSGGAGGTSSVSCSGNQDCLALVGDKAFCGRDQMCIDLAETPCDDVIGLFANPRALVIGALSPDTFGPNRDQGAAFNAALRAAVEGYNSGLNTSAGARPLAVVSCDAAAFGASDLLVDEVGVKALIAEPTPPLVERAEAERLAIISPFFHPDLTSDRIYSVAPPPDREALALGSFISVSLLPQLNADGVTTPSIVLAAKPTDGYAAELRSALNAQLSSQAVSLASADLLGTSTPEAAAAPIVAASPDIVVLAGDADVIAVLVQIEKQWTASRRPFYVLSDRLEVPQLFSSSGLEALAGDDPSTRERVFGAGVSTSLTQQSAADFVARMAGTDPRISGAVQVYDATYLLAYAAAAAHLQEPLDGDALLAGLLRLWGGSAVVDVGPSGRTAALDVLLGDGASAIDLNGASGPLDFEAGAAATEVQIWCVGKRGAGYGFVNTGQSLGLDDVFGGTLQPCN